MGQCRQFIDEVEADDDADGSDEVEQGAMEFPRDFRVFAAHDDDADEVDQEDGQGPCIGQFDDVHERDEAGNDGDEDGAPNGDQIRCVEGRMDLAELLRQHAVAGYGKEDAGLTEEIDDERRDDTGQDADGDEVSHAGPAEETQGIGNRFRCVELGVIDGSCQRQRYGNVQGHTDDDGGDDADWQVT